jgi:uncharacterized OB-fold protein
MNADNLLRPQTGSVPHASSRVGAPFWLGCQSGELRYQRCQACGEPNFPPTEHCRHCLSADLSWLAGGGTGEIYSWTVVYRPVTAEFAPPYAPAIVTLDEGYQMLTNIVGVALAELGVGLRVQVQFHSLYSTSAKELTLPYFTRSP